MESLPLVEMLWPMLTWLGLASAKSLVVISLILLLRRLFSQWLAPQTRFCLWFALIASLLVPVGFSIDIEKLNPSSFFESIFSEKQSQSIEDSQPKSAAQSGASSTDSIDSNSKGFSDRATIDISSLETETAAASRTQSNPNVVVKSAVDVNDSSYRWWLCLFWLLGAAFFVAVTINNLIQQFFVLRETDKADVGTAALLSDCKEELKLRQRVQLLQSKTSHSPLVFGGWRPKIIFPKGLLKDLNREQLRHVFLHELTHIKRGDIFTNWLCTAVQILYWFNPVVWIAMHWLRADMEQACDASVLKILNRSERARYGKTLLKLTDLALTPMPFAQSLGIAEDNNQLKERIAMITRFKNTTIKQSVVAVLAIVSLSCVGTITASESESHKNPFAKYDQKLLKTESWQTIEKYCFECHNSKDYAGSLALDLMSPDNVVADAEVWEKAIKKMRGGYMPSPDREMPDQLAIKKTVYWLESSIDSAAAINSEAEPSGSNSATGLSRRLANLIWGAAPDDELQRLEKEKLLNKPEVLEQQVKRMLADPKAKAMVRRFTDHWLNLDLEMVKPDHPMFRDANDYYTALAMFKDEITLFVDSVLRSDDSIVRLLDADYTFINDRLAEHYGIKGVHGSEFRKVELADESRHGLLSKGAILMRTSYQNRTSPTLRGAWIMDHILGAPSAPPPPNIEALAEAGDKNARPTVKATVEQHTENPNCFRCHGVLDPFGFSLENFDSVGLYTKVDKNSGAVIDATGILADGTKVNGPQGLRTVLVDKYSNMFVQTFVENLLAYSLSRSVTFPSREVDYKDVPMVRKIVKDSAKDDYRFESILLNLVKNDPWKKGS